MSRLRAWKLPWQLRSAYKPWSSAWLHSSKAAQLIRLLLGTPRPWQPQVSPTLLPHVLAGHSTTAVAGTHVVLSAPLLSNLPPFSAVLGPFGVMLGPLWCFIRPPRCLLRTPCSARAGGNGWSSAMQSSCHLVPVTQQQAVDSASLLVITPPAKRLCSIASFMPQISIVHEAQLIRVMTVWFCCLVVLHTIYTCAFKPGCLISHNRLHSPYSVIVIITTMLIIVIVIIIIIVRIIIIIITLSSS